MKVTKEYIKKLLKHLEDKKLAWCFDEDGALWTRESASLFLLSETAYYNRR